MNTHAHRISIVRVVALGSVFAACGSPAAPVSAAAVRDADASAPPPATPQRVGALGPVARAEARPPFARDADGVRAAIRSRAPGVAHCYTDFSAGRGGVEGQVFMHMVVDPAGVVTTAEQGKAIADSAAPAPNAVAPRQPIEDAVLSGCIAKELKQLRFLGDSGGKETRVDYPIQLSPKRVVEGRI